MYFQLYYNEYFVIFHTNVSILRTNLNFVFGSYQVFVIPKLIYGTLKVHFELCFSSFVYKSISRQGYLNTKKHVLTKLLTDLNQHCCECFLTKLQLPLIKKEFSVGNFILFIYPILVQRYFIYLTLLYIYMFLVTHPDKREYQIAKLITLGRIRYMFLVEKQLKYEV